MNDTLLKLLRLLVESMPIDMGADGYTNASAEQREARELLCRLEKERDEDNSDGNVDYDFHKLLNEHSRPDVPYPHYICPVCGDWFHMPFKFCKCPHDLRNGDVITTSQEIVRPYIDLSPLPWYRRLLRWLKGVG